MANIRKASFPRKSRARTWLALVGISLIIIVLGSMIAGILIPPGSSGNFALVGSGLSGSSESTSASGNDTAIGRSPDVDLPAAAMPTASAVSGASGGASGATSVPGNKVASAPTTSNALPPDQLVIRNGTVSLTSQDVDKTILDLRALATEKSGIVFSSSSEVRSYGTYASITLQVPSNTFDDVLNRVHQMTGVKVESENTTSQDVTEEYVDVQAQINNLKVTETQLTTLMNKATDLDDVIEIQQQLTSVRGQIDQRQARINYLDKHTSTSNITFTIAPVSAPTQTTKPAEWDAGTTLADAWAGSVRGLQGLYKVVITIGVWAVWLGPIFLILFLLLAYLFRRIFPRRSTPPAPITTVAPPVETENAA